MSVTAVIAVKNGEKTLRRAIESLLGQTVKLDKIVIVNDASIDKTGDVIQGLIDENPDQIHCVELMRTHWVYRARNIGAEKVDTEYMFFLDSDDWVDKTYVGTCMDILNKHPEAGFVYTDMTEVSGEMQTVVELPYFNPKLLQSRNYIHYSAFMRTDIFKRLGGYSEYLNDCRNHMTEWHLWLEMVQNNIKGAKWPRPLFYYQKSAGQMSANTERNRTDMYLQVIGLLGADIGKQQIKKPILLVCHGREYLNKSHMSWEVYGWRSVLDKFGTVLCFFYDIETELRGHDGMIASLLETIETVQPELIFHPAYKHDIGVKVWASISEQYQTLCWMCDDGWRFESYSKEYCKGFRHTVTTNKSVYGQYSKDGYGGAIKSQ